VTLSRIARASVLFAPCRTTRQSRVLSKLFAIISSKRHKLSSRRFQTRTVASDGTVWAPSCFIADCKHFPTGNSVVVHARRFRSPRLRSASLAQVVPTPINYNAPRWAAPPSPLASLQFAAGAGARGAAFPRGCSTSFCRVFRSRPSNRQLHKTFRQAENYKLNFRWGHVPILGHPPRNRRYGRS